MFTSILIAVVTIYSSHVLALLNFLLLLLCGDIEQNPGKNARPSRVTVGIWNVNSLLTKDGSKIPFIESYQSQMKFDVFGICESSLNDKKSLDDVHIDGFTQPFRCDSKRSNDHAQGGGCFCIFAKIFRF